MDEIYKEEDEEDLLTSKSTFHKGKMEIIENITHEIEKICELIQSQSSENELFLSSKRLLDHLNEMAALHKINLKDKTMPEDIVTITELTPLFHQDFISSLFKVLQNISCIQHASEPLYCLTYSLFFNKEAKALCLEHDFFSYLSRIFEDAMTLSDDNCQARVMMPICDILMKCCDEEEEAKIILESGIFDNIMKKSFSHVSQL